MRRIITLALLGVVSLGGVAAADEHHRGHVERHENHGYNRGAHAYHAYNRQTYAPRYGGHRGYYYNYGYRPYYGHRYFDYYHRPTLIVEGYGPRPGFIWISGEWYWDGGEWLWQPGHYERVGYIY